MKKHLGILCSLILVLSLAACGTDFDGSRTGNNNEFVMDYKVFPESVKFIFFYNQFLK